MPPVRLIDVGGTPINFNRVHTLSTERLQRSVEAADAGEEVDEPERGARHDGKLSLVELLFEGVRGVSTRRCARLTTSAAPQPSATLSVRRTAEVQPSKDASRVWIVANQRH